MTARDIRSVQQPPFRPPSVNFRLVGLIAAGVIAGALLYSMIYQIEPEAVGVVQTYSCSAEIGTIFRSSSRF